MALAAQRQKDVYLLDLPIKFMKIRDILDRVEVELGVFQYRVLVTQYELSHVS